MSKTTLRLGQRTMLALQSPDGREPQEFVGMREEGNAPCLLDEYSSFAFLLF